MDRLSRDQEDVAGIFKRTRFAGVQIITLAEGEITELHVGLKGTMNALFLKDLADKTRRGLRGRVEKGKAGGGLCFGYRPVKRVDSDGEAIRGDREIVEHEAEIVRRIFSEFAAGASPKAIVHKLYREGVAGPSGKGGTPSTIHGSPKRGNGILNNELYIGKLVWNRQRFLKDPASGRRISRLNPKEQWLVSDVPELRIVSDEFWAAAKHHQESTAKAFASANGSKGERLNRLKRQPHLLSGLLVCGRCGGPYTIRGRDRYACANHYARGTCSNRLGVARAELEARVLTGLRDHLVSAEAVAAAIRAYHEERNRLNQDRRAQAELDRKELIKVEKSIKAIISSIEEGMYHPSMKARIDELENKRAALEAKIADVPGNTLPDVLPNVAELYKAKIQRLHDALNEPNVREEAGAVLRSLIARIVLTPNGSGRLDADLHGELAAVIQLANSPAGNLSSQLGSGAGRFALVAGACNKRFSHPLLIRLAA